MDTIVAIVRLLVSVRQNDLRTVNKRYAAGRGRGRVGGSTETPRTDRPFDDRTEWTAGTTDNPPFARKVRAFQFPPLAPSPLFFSLASPRTTLPYLVENTFTVPHNYL